MADALEYLGREGVGTRRSHRGQVSYLTTTGPVAGQFLHRTSRALDPHLHTHVVVANVAEGVDGVWSSVDSRRLHAHLGAAQALYHARLRGELGDRMGAAWSVRPSGVGDVVGVDPGLCRLFSTRAASMDEYDHRHGSGGSGRGSTVAAFHADRPDKDRRVTVDHLVTEWHHRASDLGVDLGDLTRSVGAHRRLDDLEVDQDGLRHRIEGLADTARPIVRRHLVAALAASADGGATVRQVEVAVGGLLEACGPPTQGRGDTTRAGPGPDSGWDVAHVVRVVEGLGVDHDWSDGLDGSRSDTAVAGRDSTSRRVSDQVVARASSRMVETPAVRRLRADAPAAFARSLGIER